ncbi:MAG: hypothetical protein M3375_07275 [Actinomycetota bacterium]|nr:hypothetical protein [Actinomycetota bacterium]
MASNGKRPPPKALKQPVETPRDREAVLSDFRKVAGPLRGRNRGKSPKA